MKKSITISIPEPCHEDWSTMTPTEKGKFCAVCTKEVFDFTKATDEDLIKKLDAGKSLCGRFKKSQLEREVKMERKSRTNLLPYAASLLVPLTFMIPMQGNATTNLVHSEKPFTSLGVGSIYKDKSIVTITGFITNAEGVPVQNASVMVLETGHSVLSNIDGSYKIVCTSGSSLRYQMDTYKDQVATLGKRNAEINVSLKRKDTNFIIRGNVAIVPAQQIIEETLEGEIEIQKEEITPPETKEVTKVETLEKKEESKYNVKISGTVTDDSGLPLPGAYVIMKGTTIGTQTNFDGLYTLEVEANATLVFSYLGYVTKEVIASNISNTMDLKMDADIQGEVIILGGYYVDAGPQHNNPFKYSKPDYDPVREEKIRKRKLAKANENEFKRIQIARKKEAKALKRAQKGKK